MGYHMCLGDTFGDHRLPSLSGTSVSSASPSRVEPERVRAIRPIHLRQTGASEKNLPPERCRQVTRTPFGDQR